MNNISFNNNWTFTKTFTEDFLKGGTENTSSCRIPHTVEEIPYNYCDEKDYQMVCGYRKDFLAENSWKGKRIFITFMGAAHIATIYLNGKELMTHSCGYTAFSVELTEALNYGESNSLVVKLDTRETSNIPPFGFVIDYLTYGGIYREVFLEIKDSCYIKDAFVYTPDLCTLKAQLQLSSAKAEGCILAIYDADKNKLAEKDLVASEAELEYEIQLNNPSLWSPEKPYVYTAEFQLYASGAVTIDKKTVAFGVRTAEFKSDGFYLNGEKYKLRGLNRHQSFPYVGYAMPESMQRLDADILKHELAVNAVRTSHYPQSQHFIDCCDELGLLVFTEIPGWQHIGDEDWKLQAIKNTEEMVLQYRNHPSIILWGVRINESQDDDEFYKRTNTAAKALDPTRATSGVRYLEKSSLLEDVYGFNDFSHTGDNPGLKTKQAVTSNMSKGYLVSECNGHMYPTKPFDDETHRLSHALRHANTLNSMYGQQDIAGCFGWAMTDYNTHRDFGSGDRICYHGVMDMFRNPKLAAYSYASQGEEDAVLGVSSEMNIGEYAAGNIGDLYVFTNADSVRLYKNNEFVKEYAASNKKLGHLPHPPILIDDTIGCLLERNELCSHNQAEGIKQCLLAIQKHGQSNLPLKYKLKLGYLMLRYKLSFADGYKLYSKYVGNWGGTAPVYRFEAIKDGQVVKAIEKGDPGDLQLVANVSHQELMEKSTYDTASIRINALDSKGNLAAYFQEPVTLTLSGPFELIGPKVISLKGGMAGTYIKTTGEAGEGELRISSANLKDVVIKFTALIQEGQ